MVGGALRLLDAASIKVERCLFQGNMAKIVTP